MTAKASRRSPRESKALPVARGRGRPTGLTPQGMLAIARSLADGRTVAEAGKAADVPARTLERWLHRGRAAQDIAARGGEIPAREQPYVGLLVAIDKAAMELTEETRERVVEFLRTGAPLAAAASAAKVPLRTLDRWLELGRRARDRATAGEPAGASEIEYLRLLDDVDEAMGNTEIRALATLQRAMLNGDARAAAFILERMWPERYARKQGRPAIGIPPDVRLELEQLRADQAAAAAQPGDSWLDDLRARATHAAA